jgi:hypothetical protein
MNRIEELKKIALNYAKEFQKDNINLNFNEQLNNAEWYIVMRLSQIYYNLITKVITREQAKEQQHETFEYVRNNNDFFE